MGIHGRNLCHLWAWSVPFLGFSCPVFAHFTPIPGPGPARPWPYFGHVWAFSGRVSHNLRGLLCLPSPYFTHPCPFSAHPEPISSPRPYYAPSTLMGAVFLRVLAPILNPRVANFSPCMPILNPFLAKVSPCVGQNLHIPYVLPPMLPGDFEAASIFGIHCVPCSFQPPEIF